MKSIYLILGITTAIVSAKAISYDVNVGTGLDAPAGSHFTATGGDLEIKNHNGYIGLGVSGGASGGEIDLGQKLTITFDTAQILKDITLSFLYNGPEYDDGHEIAALKINGGTEYILTATGEDTATWTGSGLVENVSLATINDGAIWKITNPFGLTGVTSIELYPLVYPVGSEAPNDSDFSLRSFNTEDLKPGTTSVPDAGSSAFLLGLGGIALASLRRNTR